MSATMAQLLAAAHEAHQRELTEQRLQHSAALRDAEAKAVATRMMWQDTIESLTMIVMLLRRRDLPEQTLVMRERDRALEQLEASKDMGASLLAEHQRIQGYLKHIAEASSKEWDTAPVVVALEKANRLVLALSDALDTSIRWHEMMIGPGALNIPEGFLECLDAWRRLVEEVALEEMEAQ